MKKVTEKSNFFNIFCLISLLVFIVVTVFMASCTSGSIRGTAIEITSPMKDVTAGNIEIKVAVTNFDLVDKEGKANNLGEGHIIYYMDVPAPTYYDYPAITKGGTYKTSHQTSMIWADVTPGQHNFSVQLVNNNNKPLPAPAADSVTLNVNAPDGDPSISINMPGDGAELPPGIVIMTVTVNNFILSAKDMGALNNNGAGHLIYYIDEDPPVNRGEPAITANAIVSTELRHLWKMITEGEHTFAVQLVNNDDTPLNPPVVNKITLTIKKSD